MINGFQLSPQQKRLWLLQEGGHAAYRAQCAVSVRGRLDAGLLKAALASLVERHEILRTSFRCLPGMTIPMQVVEEGGVPVIREHDLRQLAPEERQAWLARLLGEGGGEFSFSEGESPLEIDLAAAGPEEHLLVIRLPALHADSAALRSLVADLAHAYSAGLEGGEVADEVMQYADLAAWQNELLESEERATGRDYWRQQGIEIPRAVLPFAAQSDGEAPFLPGFVLAEVGPELTVRVSELAKTFGTSPEVVVLSCWEVLLWRLTGESKVVVAAAFDGRRYAELRDAVGLLARSLPLGPQLADDLTFEELVRRTEARMSEHKKWQEYFSWDQAVQGNGVPPPTFAPFAFENEDAPEELSAGGLVFQVVQQYSCTERFTVKLCFRRGAGAAWIEIHFDPARLGRQDAERITGQMQAVLASAVQNPGIAVGEMDLLGEAERRWLLETLNETASELPRAQRIHELFEECAGASPEALAVICDGQRVSYGELNRRANRIAGFLRKSGIGPEQRVGICDERSVEMLAGILGILKAGGAYVPLDPSYPRERLAFLLEDSQAEFLLVRERLLSSLPEFAARVLLLDSAASDEDGEEMNPAPLAAADHIAYIIYTSGSTGRPKGVQVSHRNLVHSTVARNRYHGEPGRQLLLASFSFDSSVAGIFWTLCFGGTLVLPPEGAQREPRWLAQFIAEHRITDYIGLPSVYRLLLQEAEAGQLDSLRKVIVAGEVCPRELVMRQREELPGARLCNEYGPTEGTVWSTVFDCTAACETQGTVPIGRAIEGTEIYLLHSRLGPVPIGVPGQLFLGGAGLARGYQGRPGLTAERFVPNPFGREPGSRLYKTGDLARRRPDGEIEFLGRTDEQIKIRGYRVELGEIEAWLQAHPVVDQAAVVVREETPGNPQLVAFLVPAGQSAHISEPLLEEVRSYLRERVPDYMVPSSWRLLQVMPLTPNGKVDRRALEQMKIQGAAIREHVAPRNLTEKMIAEIWGEVLGLDQVSVTADFFELGGHSLIATQVMSRVREAMRVELPVRTLFKFPTVAGLAETVAESLRVEPSLDAPAIRPVPRDTPLPLSFSQQRMWLVHQLDPDSPAYNIPSAVRLSGDLDIAVLQYSLNEVVRRHEILRTVFRVVEGQPAQQVLPPVSRTFPMIDLADLPLVHQQAEVSRLAREEAHLPFDLARGPLLRASLLRLGKAEHVALLTMHHIVSDAWSNGILVREIAVHYEAFARGLPSPLPDLPIQYADFASWQRDWLQGDVLESQLTYWRRQLGGGLPRVDLPTDRPRPPVRSTRGGKLPLSLPDDLSTSLRELAQHEGATLYMVLLAGFQALLHAYVQQDDLVVGTNVANRNRLETEGLIGFFINQLVLRTNLSGNPTFRELLAQVREVSLAAYAHQDLPFERLVEEVQPERDPSRPLLFQVKLELLNAPMSPLKLPGLTVSPVEIDRRVARYDLHLSLSDDAAGIRGAVLYSAELFDEATIARMMDSFDAVLSNAVADADVCLSELERDVIHAERQARSTQRELRKKQNLDDLKQVQRRTVTAASAAEPVVTE